MTIQETNIERILEDTLWQEVALLETEIEKVLQVKLKLEQRKDRLIRIADAADIPRPLYEPDPRD